MIGDDAWAAGEEERQKSGPWNASSKKWGEGRKMGRGHSRGPQNSFDKTVFGFNVSSSTKARDTIGLDCPRKKWFVCYFRYQDERQRWF